MKSLSSKKAQINTIAPAIISLMIAGIFLVLGIIILQEIRNTDVIAQANSKTVINETTSAVITPIGVSLAQSVQPGSNSFVIISAINATSGNIIPSTNYTINNLGILKFTDGSSLGFNNSKWNVTYSLKYGDAAYVSTNDTLIGLGTFSDFWTLIVLAIVITVVIGLLLIVFGSKRGLR